MCLSAGDDKLKVVGDLGIRYPYNRDGAVTSNKRPNHRQGLALRAFVVVAAALGTATVLRGQQAPRLGLDSLLVATALASDGRPAALLPCYEGTVIGRLAGQLTALGARSPIVITRPPFRAALQEALGHGVEVRESATVADDLTTIAALVRGAGGSVLIGCGDIVTHAEALEGLVASPRTRTGVLAGGRRRALPFLIRTRRGDIVSAASPYHSVRTASATFLGVLRVDVHDVPALAAAAERLAELVAAPPTAWTDELERKATRWRREAVTAEEQVAGDDPA